MKLSLTFLVFGFLFLLHPALSASVIPAKLPFGYAADGDIQEWRQTKPFFDDFHLIVGKGKSGFDAKAWLVVNESGVYVAGEVKDSTVLLSQKGSESIASDHAELWIAFDAPEIPPLAYVNQFGEQKIQKESDCKDNSIENPEKCIFWFREQTERRKKISRLFTAQYLLFNESIQEAFFSGSRDLNLISNLVAERAACKKCSSHYKVVSGGYTFEAFIPLESFPAFGRSSLSKLRMKVDFTDNNTGRFRQENFYSSNLKARFGVSETFPEIHLEKEIDFTSDFQLHQKIFSTKKYEDNLFLFPQKNIPELFGFVNPAIGYQYAPEADSPEIRRFPLKPEKLNDYNGGTLYLTIAGLNELKEIYSLLFVKDGIFFLERFAGACSYIKPGKIFYQKNGSKILVQCNGTVNPTGSGQCGACPTSYFESYRIDQKGISFLKEFILPDDDPGKMAMETEDDGLQIQETGERIEISWKEYDPEDMDKIIKKQKTLNWSEF